MNQPDRPGIDITNIQFTGEDFCSCQWKLDRFSFILMFGVQFSIIYSIHSDCRCGWNPSPFPLHSPG